MGSAFTILVIVVILALAFDYINGFHDTANAVATVVSTNVLPARTAVLLAAVCNFAGAFVGVGVAKTIGGDIAAPASITQLVVAAALLGAIYWNLLTWYYGIPSSWSARRTCCSAWKRASTSVTTRWTPSARWW